MAKTRWLNPETNKLAGGVTEADVVSAVSKSGYPLQNIVADYFEQAHFRTIEEWSFLDKDVEQLRTIDVKAEKALYEYRKGRLENKIRPSLVFLVECKQAQLPCMCLISHFFLACTNKRSQSRPMTTIRHITLTP